MPAAIVAGLVNEKGGVGKTTVAFNLAAAIARQGPRVLLVDCDPRADLTLTAGVTLAQDQPSLYDLLLEEDRHISEVLVPLPHLGLDIIPAERDLAAIEAVWRELPHAQWPAGLRRVFEQAKQSYELILVDSPPGLSALTATLLRAIDTVIVPQQCSFTALYGLRELMTVLDEIREVWGTAPDILGIIVTMFRRTRHSAHIIEILRQRFGGLLFDTVIPLTVRLQEAPEFGLPIVEYEPSNPAAQAFMELAKEVLERWHQRAQSAG